MYYNSRVISIGKQVNHHFKLYESYKNVCLKGLLVDRLWCQNEMVPADGTMVSCCFNRQSTIKFIILQNILISIYKNYII